MKIRKLSLPLIAAMAVSAAAVGVAHAGDAMPRSDSAMDSASRNQSVVVLPSNQDRKPAVPLPDMAPIVHGKDAPVTVDPWSTDDSWWKDE